MLGSAPHPSGHLAQRGPNADENGTLSCDLLLPITEAHPHKVTAVCFAKCSHSLISGSLDNTLVQWDLKNGDRMRELFSQSFGVNRVWALKDRVLSCFYDSTATVWYLDQDTEPHRVLGHRGQQHVCKISSNGKEAFSDGADYSMKRWNLNASAQALTTFRGHTDEVMAICLTPDERHVLTGSRDKSLKLWRVMDGQLMGEFYFEQAVRAVTLGADGELAVVGLNNGQLCFLRVKY